MKIIKGIVPLRKRKIEIIRRRLERNKPDCNELKILKFKY
jgi:hypothetical protein